MQNQNSPAFPINRPPSKQEEIDGIVGTYHPGLTKREWITLELFKSLIKANPPIVMQSLDGERKMMVPNPLSTAHLADQLAELLLRFFDQANAAFDPSDPLYAKRSAAVAAIDAGIADDA